MCLRRAVWLKENKGRVICPRLLTLHPSCFAQQPRELPEQWGLAGQRRQAKRQASKEAGKQANHFCTHRVQGERKPLHSVDLNVHNASPLASLTQFISLARGLRFEFFFLLYADGCPLICPPGWLVRGFCCQLPVKVCRPFLKLSTGV